MTDEVAAVTIEGEGMEIMMRIMASCASDRSLIGVGNYHLDSSAGA